MNMSKNLTILSCSENKIDKETQVNISLRLWREAVPKIQTEQSFKSDLLLLQIPEVVIFSIVVQILGFGFSPQILKRKYKNYEFLCKKREKKTNQQGNKWNKNTLEYNIIYIYKENTLEYNIIEYNYFVF